MSVYIKHIARSDWLVFFFSFGFSLMAQMKKKKESVVSEKVIKSLTVEKIRRWRRRGGGEMVRPCGLDFERGVLTSASCLRHPFGCISDRHV